MPRVVKDGEEPVIATAADEVSPPAGTAGQIADAQAATRSGNYTQAPLDTLEANQRLADRVLEQFEAGAFARPPAPAAAVREVNTVQSEVARTERELLQQEARNQKLQRQEFMRAAGEGRLPRAVTASPFDAMPDPTLILDEDGEPAGTPGYHKKHVRMVDDVLRESSGRVSNMAVWGYRPVKSRVTGKPIATQFGLLMECPPEAEGQRRAFHGRRVVSEQLANERRLDAAIDSVNQEFGTEAIRPFRDREHTAGRK